MRQATFISRRNFLASLIVGSGSLLIACAGPASVDTGVLVGQTNGPANPGVPAASASGPAVAPAVVRNGTNAPVVTGTTEPDPLAAVADLPSPTALAARGIAVEIPLTPTGVPTQVAQSTPRPIPTSTAVPIPTAIPTATPIPIPYIAGRLGDVLGESITSYAGSIASRAHNVQLATRLINGAKVPPGGVFSFDDVVGDQTEAHGFQVAWGIVNGKDGVPETIHADAGGICQVATTVFQSAYWAGLPMVRRFHHLYWIAHYGQPPYGGLGLDATVDFAPVDLQFQNTTSDWIRLDATYDSSHVHVRVVGVNPGWKVTAGAPKITNLVKTDPTLVRRPDPTMNPGQQLYIETAQDGFDVTVERLVKLKSTGELVDRYVFMNHYEMARNVMVYGTKGIVAPPPAPATPRPAPSTPAPTAVGSPTNPAGTPTPSTSTYRTPNGQIKVPSLVGLTEAQARQLIGSIGLQSAAASYLGPGDAAPAVLNAVPVGAVLSQSPASGTVVNPGSAVSIAVRKS